MVCVPPLHIPLWFVTLQPACCSHITVYITELLVLLLVVALCLEVLTLKVQKVFTALSALFLSWNDKYVENVTGRRRVFKHSILSVFRPAEGALMVIKFIIRTCNTFTSWYKNYILTSE